MYLYILVNKKKKKLIIILNSSVPIATNAADDGENMVYAIPIKIPILLISLKTESKNNNIINSNFNV